ncbi:MAG: hypothetical protein J5590_03635 [Clostridia bacterium]|nr:hypothetical protein [Clostridia bacterium]
MNAIDLAKKTYGKISSVFEKLNKPRLMEINPADYRDKCFCTDNGSIKYIISSTITMEIKGESNKYFRQCEEHLPIKEYVYDFVNFYYDFVRGQYEPDEDEREKVLKSLKKEENLRLFLNMGGVYNPKDNAYKVFRNSESPALVGLEGFEDIKPCEGLLYFVRFSSCKLGFYRENKRAFKSPAYHSFYASKNFAYQAMGKLLGLHDYIPKCEFCFLNIDNKKEIFGYMMEDAGGVSALEFTPEERLKKVSPKLQKELINLNILDYLCGMVDHSPGNYNALTDENGMFSGVRCFDNNEPASFSTEKCFSFEGNRGESCIVSANGVINRPYLDDYLAKKLKALKKQDIYNALKKYLSKRQIRRVWQRKEYLNAAIEKTVSKRPEFLIGDEKWSRDTIQDEISGKYQKTYLLHLVSCDKFGR